MQLPQRRRAEGSVSSHRKTSVTFLLRFSPIPAPLLAHPVMELHQEFPLPLCSDALCTALVPDCERIQEDRHRVSQYCFFWKISLNGGNESVQLISVIFSSSQVLQYVRHFILQWIYTQWCVCHRGLKRCRSIPGKMVKNKVGSYLCSYIFRKKKQKTLQTGSKQVLSEIISHWRIKKVKSSFRAKELVGHHQDRQTHRVRFCVRSSIFLSEGCWIFHGVIWLSAEFALVELAIGMIKKLHWTAPSLSIRHSQRG